MQLRNIGSNQAVLCLADGVVILFSYNTPVAALIPGNGYVQTSRKFSRTTSKHINSWAGKDAAVMDHAELRALAG
jgi:hypothetical protein